MARTKAMKSAASRASRSTPARTASPTAASAKEILAALKSKGRDNTRAIYGRHGNAAERCFGVSTADMKSIAKTIRGQQALAAGLYQTGMLEAMYVAGMVADGSRMSRMQLQEWVEGAAGMRMVSEYTMPWLAVENDVGRELALDWIGSTREHVAASGWCTYAGLMATKDDQELDLREIEGLLRRGVKGIHAAPNRVRYAMNGFVIAAGAYVKPLLKQAKRAAQEIGEVTVDAGETACEVPRALAYIAKIEAMGRVGRKRKSMRC